MKTEAAGQYGDNRGRRIIRPVIAGLIFLWMFSPWVRPAGALDPRKQIRQYVHDAWGVEDGLPQASILDIQQTRDGYIWLATLEGLVRFDGVTFTVFDKRGAAELTNHQITALYEDRETGLWIGTMGGGLILRKNNAFQSFLKRDGLAGDSILSIFQDREGNIWAGCDNSGLSCLKVGARRFTVCTTQDGLAGNSVRSITQDHAGMLWLGTDSGLNRLDPATGQFSLITTQQRLADNKVYCVFTDSHGYIWAGCENGLTRIAPGSGDPVVRECQAISRESFNGASVRAICEDRQGNIWIGIFGKGLRRLTPGNVPVGEYSLCYFTVEHGLSNNKIDSLMEDREGDLWIGALDGGLNRLRDSSVTSFSSPVDASGPVTYSILQDLDGRVWFGSDSGVSRFLTKPEKNSAYWEKICSTNRGLSNETVWTMCFQDKNTLWIGTQNGLNQLDVPSGKITQFFVRDGLPSNIIRVIEKDNQGNLWIAADGGGLACYKNREFITFSPRDGLPKESIWTLYADHQGTLWMGTWGGGLCRYTDGRFTSSSTAQGLSNNIVTAIREDAEGNLWIGTYGGGLNLFNGKKFITVNSQNGLFDDTIHAIIDDSLGNLWMSCNKGIFRVSLTELVRFCNGAISQVACQAFDERHGMKNRECNGVGHPSAWKDSEGRLWFPTNDGPALIDPARLTVNKVIPPVLIEKIIVDDSAHHPPFPREESMLHFSPGKEKFEFHYTALSFPAPRDVQFKYRLEGFESGWNEVNNRRIAYYQKLPPGYYTFRVIASNNDGYWNSTGAVVSFRLAPHFYQTRWFVLMSFLSVLGILAAGYYFRVRRLKNQAWRLKLLVDERTFDLNLARDAAERARETAEKANRAKSEFLANVSHEIRTPMNAILGFAEILSERIQDPKLREHLDSISTGGQTLLRLINNILDLARIESGKIKLEEEPLYIHGVLHEIADIFKQKAHARGVTIQVVIAPETPVGVKMDGLRIRQILLNLAGNALKFTDSGFVEIGLRPAEPTADNQQTISLVFYVRDSGIGIPRDQQQRIFEAFMQQEGQKSGQYGGSGLGLAITHRLVQLMKGHIRVDSEPGKGSLFEVFIPDVPVCAISSQSSAGYEPDISDVRFHESVILVVDDTEPNRRLMKEYLSDSPIQFIEAENGQQALESARRHLPDLVLMDIKMPVMNGLEATRLMKNDVSLRHIPVIIVTASILKEEWARIMATGCNGFMLKPVQKMDLYIELMQFLPYSAPHLDLPGGSPRLRHDGSASAAEIIEKAHLNPGIIPHLPELLDILKNTELLEKWEQVKRYYIVDEFEAFVARLMELEQRFNTGILGCWAAKLNADLNLFDLERIKSTLDSFPVLIERLRRFQEEETL